jgi:BASS family bile acid:Na+ symporter
MTEILQIVFKVSLLVFIVSSMMSMVLKLTINQIVKPLEDVKHIVLSLVVNFILIPLLVFGIISVVPLNKGVRIAMLFIFIVIWNNAFTMLC